MTTAPGSRQPAADATITWISGPVLRASVARPFSINEAALVGEQQLLGEVIRLDGPYAVIQVYEDTTGLRPGDVIYGTGAALSVPLGPGLLGNIFDGLLRPLTAQGLYVAPGIGKRDADGVLHYLGRAGRNPGESVHIPCLELQRGARVQQLRRPDRRQRCRS